MLSEKWGLKYTLKDREPLDSLCFDGLCSRDSWASTEDPPVQSYSTHLLLFRRFASCSFMKIYLKEATKPIRISKVSANRLAHHLPIVWQSMVNPRGLGKCPPVWQNCWDKKQMLRHISLEPKPPSPCPSLWTHLEWVSRRPIHEVPVLQVHPSRPCCRRTSLLACPVWERTQTKATSRTRSKHYKRWFLATKGSDR